MLFRMLAKEQEIFLPQCFLVHDPHSLQEIDSSIPVGNHIDRKDEANRNIDHEYLL